MGELGKLRSKLRGIHMGSRYILSTNTSQRMRACRTHDILYRTGASSWRQRTKHASTGFFIVLQSSHRAHAVAGRPLLINLLAAFVSFVRAS